MLSDKDLANITNRLQVPLIVDDIIHGQAPLTDDTAFGLHEILSDFEPDSALLSIALSTRKIAQRFQHKAASMGVLKIECERMIADYADMWLKNANAAHLDDNVVFETLMNIPEDLETLSELIESCMPFLKRFSDEAAELLDILSVQARAQVLVAESFIDILDAQNQDDEPLANDNTELEHFIPLQAHAQASNVIQFPRSLQG